jgi:hypothetical protein
MDAQIYGALLTLGLIVIGAIGAIVKALTGRIVRDLAQNTEITRETKEASNGRLKETLDRLAAERDRVLALRTLLRERDDRMAYLEARIPEVPRVLKGYEERRQSRHTAADERAVLQRLTEDIDDPTGTDAGAHPQG